MQVSCWISQPMWAKDDQMASYLATPTENINRKDEIFQAHFLQKQVMSVHESIMLDVTTNVGKSVIDETFVSMLLYYTGCQRMNATNSSLQFKTVSINESENTQ